MCKSLFMFRNKAIILNDNGPNVFPFFNLALRMRMVLGYTGLKSSVRVRKPCPQLLGCRRFSFRNLTAIAKLIISSIIQGVELFRQNYNWSIWPRPRPWMIRASRTQGTNIDYDLSTTFDLEQSRISLGFSLE